MFTGQGGVPGMQRCDVHFGGHCDPRAEDLTDFFCKREW